MTTFGGFGGLAASSRRARAAARGLSLGRSSAAVATVRVKHTQTVVSSKKRAGDSKWGYGRWHRIRGQLQRYQPPLSLPNIPKSGSNETSPRISFPSNLSSIHECNHSEVGWIGPEIPRRRNGRSDQFTRQHGPFIPERRTDPRSRPCVLHILRKRPRSHPERIRSLQHDTSSRWYELRSPHLLAVIVTICNHPSLRISPMRDMPETHAQRVLPSKVEHTTSATRTAV